MLELLDRPRELNSNSPWLKLWVLAPDQARVSPLLLPPALPQQACDHRPCGGAHTPGGDAVFSVAQLPFPGFSWHVSLQTKPSMCVKPRSL